MQHEDKSQGALWDMLRYAQWALDLSSGLTRESVEGDDPAIL